jgi:hypothetical protein
MSNKRMGSWTHQHHRRLTLNAHESRVKIHSETLLDGELCHIALVMKAHTACVGIKSRCVAWLTAGLIPALVSCAASRSPLVLGPVGPETSGRVVAISSGYLKVYSATEDYHNGSAEDLDFQSVHYYPHTNYAVYSEDGKIVKKVRNAIGVHDEDPALVEMPAGTYTVLAESERYGMVKVKVVIEPGKLTTVNLEYNKQPPSGSSKGNYDLVRLPNGSIVGWRADASTQANAVGTVQVK